MSERMTRRDALMRTAAVLTPSLAPLSFAQAQDDASKKLGWAIVGIGGLSMGQILPGFAECTKSRVTALVSGSPAKAKEQAEKYGAKRVYHYDNYDNIKSDPDIDVVYIVLPNGMHAEYTIRALNAGKHVLCEKPMANTPEECEAMIRAARRNNRKLMIAYRCQYEPYNRAAIEICRTGQIGKLKTIVSDHGFRIGDPSQWRLNKKLAGGGSLMDIGIYSLQAARYLTGEEPTEVEALSYSTPNDPRFKEVEETIHFMLRFPSGTLANLTSSYGYSGANRIRVIGDLGFVDMEPATSYGGIRLRMAGKNGYEEKKFAEKNQFGIEMDYFSDCILNKKEPKTAGEEGLRDVKIMMAIYEAARTGGRVKLTGEK
ncbi:MAG: Gfo/Idh/MocA family oxidoreductase [Capsulimonadales bacterium]|nr:Gfo/Idh/MocA family oxidoreductase [Capsulimonadales bacterium]